MSDTDRLIDEINDLASKHRRAGTPLSGLTVLVLNEVRNTLLVLQNSGKTAQDTAQDTRSDGCPAFPRVGEGFDNPSYSTPGMTLRDWFAGQALIGLLFSADYTGNETPRSGDDLIEFANTDTSESYMIADAMLAARKGGAA